MYSITELIYRFDTDEFSSNLPSKQIEAGWYDWFCSDKLLRKKTYKLINKLTQILRVQNNKFNPDTCYMFMKNNCPCNGSLYDSFSICDIETDNVIYWITPASGHDSEKGKAQVFGKGSFDIPLAEGTWKDVLNYFKK